MHIIEIDFDPVSDTKRSAEALHQSLQAIKDMAWNTRNKLLFECALRCQMYLDSNDREALNVELDQLKRQMRSPTQA